MIKQNSELGIVSTILLMVLLSCSQDSSKNSTTNATLEEIDPNQLNTVSDFTKTIVGYLDEGLTDHEEGKLIQLFDLAIQDTIMNEVIQKLATIHVGAEDAFTHIHTQWDKQTQSPNEHRLGSLIRKTYNYNQLSMASAELISYALLIRYDGNRKKRAELLCNCYESAQISDEAIIVLRNVLHGVTGLKKDMHALDRCREKLGIEQ